MHLLLQNDVLFTDDLLVLLTDPQRVCLGSFLVLPEHIDPVGKTEGEKDHFHHRSHRHRVFGQCGIGQDAPVLQHEHHDTCQEHAPSGQEIDAWSITLTGDEVGLGQQVTGEQCGDRLDHLVPAHAMTHQVQGDTKSKGPVEPVCCPGEGGESFVGVQKMPEELARCHRRQRGEQDGSLGGQPGVGRRQDHRRDADEGQLGQQHG